MKKNSNNKQKFQTNIREPLWQQIVSILIVLIYIGLTIYTLIKHAK